jgi:hypothetical protein
VAEPASVHHEVLPMDELMSSESSRDSLGKCLSVFLCEKKKFSVMRGGKTHAAHDGEFFFFDNENAVQHMFSV